MPDNWQEPSHTLMRQVANEQGLPDRGRQPLLPPDAWYDMLTRQGCEVDIWRTTYFHPLSSHQAISDWLQGTGLRPYLAGLDEQSRNAFRHAMSNYWPNTIRYSVTERCSCDSPGCLSWREKSTSNRNERLSVAMNKENRVKNHPVYQDETS